MDDKKNNDVWERTASVSDGGLRLDKFWGRELSDAGVSRGRVKSWIESGLATVDGKVVTKGKHKLMGHETLRIGAAENEAGDEAPQPMAGDLTALFEDEHMLVVSKPAGLTTHPAPSEQGPTLVNYLLNQWPDIATDISGMDEQRPGIVHRLDKDTSGIMAVARTEAARLKLAADFSERRVHKVYLAIVHGCPAQKQGLIDAPMGRHQTQKTKMDVLEKGGREARSEYRVLWTGPGGLASLVAVRIHTGRTHQIRVHMAHIGHPLVGDGVYGAHENTLWQRRPDSLATLAPRQMLHAWYLSIAHPATGEQITLTENPPDDFCMLLAGLTRECLRVGIVGMPGCGKSALLSLLRGLDQPCFSADESVARLYGPDGDGAAMIRQRFGGAYSREDGSVDKSALFTAMCESEILRREVMDMVHPMVRHECEEFFSAHRDAVVAYAEIPLLLEGGWHTKGDVDCVVGVQCPADKRTGELREKRGLDMETLAIFDSWQWAEKDKLEVCDLVLDNDGGLDDLKGQAEKLMDWVQNRFDARNTEFDDWLNGVWADLADRIDRERTGA
ncbi:dephospho-CoA kinase [Pseudodesulfovibrio sediminis]|uniref:Dephospho-CoA kinase n=1 Tax=Pseudodesulfovibrio sediminis TaxID=2810563 RepID=A0ABM7PAM0_9BACT|nr:dephospho-CoA kinase [Pseudodesulfovibrio sediminis]BCS90167.1 dephospho-CoA kinase [Pseudodesulfovibrio sediminis]